MLGVHDHVLQVRAEREIAEIERAAQGSILDGAGLPVSRPDLRSRRGKGDLVLFSAHARGGFVIAARRAFRQAVFLLDHRQCRIRGAAAGKLDDIGKARVPHPEAQPAPRIKQVGGEHEEALGRRAIAGPEERGRSPIWKTRAAQRSRGLLARQPRHLHERSEREPRIRAPSEEHVVGPRRGPAVGVFDLPAIHHAKQSLRLGIAGRRERPRHPMHRLIPQ